MWEVVRIGRVGHKMVVEAFRQIGGGLGFGRKKVGKEAVAAAMDDKWSK